MKQKMNFFWTLCLISLLMHYLSKIYTIPIFEKWCISRIVKENVQKLLIFAVLASYSIRNM